MYERVEQSYNVAFTVKNMTTGDEWIEYRSVVAFDKRPAINIVLQEFKEQTNLKVIYINSVN